MSAVPLFDGHCGCHCRKSRLRRLGKRIVRAALRLWDLLATWDALMPPAPYIPPADFGATAWPPEDNAPDPRDRQSGDLPRPDAASSGIADESAAPAKGAGAALATADTSLLGEWHPFSWSEDTERLAAPLFAVRPDGVIHIDADGHISARKLMRIGPAAPVTAGLPLLGGEPVEPLPPGRIPPQIAAYFDAQAGNALALGPEGCEQA